MYATGGLEPAYEEDETIEIDNVTYRLNDRFRSSLRSSMIDWGTFKEMYQNDIDTEVLLGEIKDILFIQHTPEITNIIEEALKTLYHLPAESHLIALSKQYMIYEPVSAAIKMVFDKFRDHYEMLVEQYIIARNKYILNAKTDDKPNNFEELVMKFEKNNKKYNLQSSSVILLFLNPPEGFKHYMHLTVRDIPETTTFKEALESFHYPGFCPKVPKERLAKLLDFPVLQIAAAIKALDPESMFPDYNKISKHIQKVLKTAPTPPKIEDQYKRLEPPEKNRVIWYVDEILNMRKSFMDEAKKYNLYYTQQAKIFLELSNILQKELNVLQ